MAQYAFLVGSAPQDYRQKRLVNFYNNLKSEYSFVEKDIYIFPNGVDEILLEYALTNAIEKKPTKILLYICTNSEATSEEIIRKSVIAKYIDMADKAGIDMRVIYDYDDELISEEPLGWKRVV